MSPKLRWPSGHQPEARYLLHILDRCIPRAVIIGALTLVLSVRFLDSAALPATAAWLALRHGDPAAAERGWIAASLLSPTNSAVAYGALQVEIEQGDSSTAWRMLQAPPLLGSARSEMGWRLLRTACAPRADTREAAEAWLQTANYLAAAEAAQQSGDTGQARLFYCLAVFQRSPDAQLLVAMGKTMLDALNDPSAAEAQFRRALDVDPNSFESAKHLGVIALSQGRFDDARAWATKGEELYPGSIQASVQWRLQQMVSIAVREGDLADAARQADELRRLDPDGAVPVILTGWVKGIAGYLDEAVSMEKDALTRCRSYADQCSWAHSLLAAFLSRSGSVTEAVTHAQAAATLAPNEAYYRLQWADLLYQSGSLTEAGEVYRVAQQLKLTTPQRALVQARLTELGSKQ